MIAEILVVYRHRRYSCAMRPLRYSVNVTLDGCCDHRAIIPDEDLHRHAAKNLEQADALLFGRVTYEMMEADWSAFPDSTSTTRIVLPCPIAATDPLFGSKCS